MCATGIDNRYCHRQEVCRKNSGDTREVVCTDGMGPSCVPLESIIDSHDFHPDFPVETHSSFPISFVASSARRVTNKGERERGGFTEFRLFFRRAETALLTVITRYTHPDIISTNSNAYRSSLSRTRTLPRGGDFASWQSRRCLPYSPLIHVSWMYVLLFDPPGLRKTCASIGLWRVVDKTLKSLSDFALGRAKRTIDFEKI